MRHGVDPAGGPVLIPVPIPPDPAIGNNHEDIPNVPIARNLPILINNNNEQNVPIVPDIPVNFASISNKLSGITFSIQNTRSLNISTKNDITVQKVLAICNLKSDFIFLSDIRLNSSKQISAVHDLEKQFFLNGYKFIHNSVTSLRGVGILINRKIINGSFKILNTLKSDDGNILCLHVEFNGIKFLLCAVYGPNLDADIVFYENLSNMLRNFECPKIVGGDWNATFDNSDPDHNLDILNMRNIPSNRRTAKILDICANLNLCEPYRNLYPNRREYTFIPSGVQNVNRSRLDFFLISAGLYCPDTSVKIPHSLSTTYFDHKTVTLQLKKRKIGRKNVIKDTILSNVDLDSHVKCAVFECYIHHFVPINGNGIGNNAALNNAARNNAARNNGAPYNAALNNVDVHLLNIGRIMTLLGEIKDCELDMAINGFNDHVDLIISGKRAEINLIFEDLPGLEYFENLNIDYEPEVFFQTLASCIQNNVLSHQSTVFKLKSAKRKRLKNIITDLKKFFDINSAIILETERQLSELVEGELRDELLHYKKFEILNSERVTPHFMNLVKASNASGNLDEITRDDGTDFLNDDERERNIHDYYKNIYSQPDNESKRTTVHDINNFLGPIKNHPIVQDSVLTNEERDEIDTDITSVELTESINNANLASAPGADGISNKFIKKYWEFFKNPLLKLCNSCYQKNELPMIFLTANIKLIPKKGDLSNIKNWRPISLLNCFYKIISRVITARLRKFMDKMTPICQKGYSSSRYCQEVLISVIEGIEKCKMNRKKGAIISLDIKKAFDSLSHNFLQGVYDFFNIGPKLKKWITLLSTKRKACIIVGGNKTTEFFDLERGNSQGDTISPFLFNLGYQILLFKLELYFQIEGTQSEFAGEINAAVTTATGRAPTVSSDPKVAAMADDCTLLVNLHVENLQVIIGVLDEFEKISGLGCNLDKTVLMPVGILEPVSQEIKDLGLQIVSEITLLGANIKNTGSSFENNGKIILEKIKKQVNWWKRFNLSLPGRIAVSKTFLYSQINYLGCFMPLSQNILNGIALEIEKFVRGKMQIGKAKIYDTVKNGGLGMFHVTDFLDSQCCAWVRRAVSMDEMWKRELFLGSFSNVFNIRKSCFNEKKNPILKNIAGGFEKFIYKFTCLNENFRKSFIFENPVLKFDANNQNYLKMSFFGEDFYRQNKIGINSLTVDSILNLNGTTKSKLEFENITGIILTENKYNKICGLVRTAVRTFSKNTVTEKKSDTVQNFCMRIRRGSKKYRKIIEGPVELHISSNIKKYSDLIDGVINLESSVRINCQWTPTYLDNSTRTFLFKLHNNLLGLNSRVAHFVRNHSASCTFCSIRRNPDDNPESTKHLFFDCPYTESVLTPFYSWILRTPTELRSVDFFVGFCYECKNKNLVMDLINIITKKYIWDCKLRFAVPNLEGLKVMFTNSYSFVYKNYRTVRDFTDKSDIFVNHYVRF